MMENTKLLYLEDRSKTAEATVIDLLPAEEDRTVVIVDKTIFYPQGGGQPFDTGQIGTKTSTFEVEQTRFEDGLVHHIGKTKKGVLSIGDRVVLEIDEEKRNLHCRLHTAGHLVDVAMINTGNRFRPSKGYHFADSPYVEYEGIIAIEEREGLKHLLNNELARLISNDSQITSKIVTNSSVLQSLCEFVPHNIPEGKPVRVVTMEGYGCACGGTHMRSTKEVQGITISKIKAKGGNTRVSYRIP